LISFPILLAAGINGLFEFIALPNSTESLPIFLIGSIFAAGVGFLSIRWLLRFLTKRSLYTFAIYCILFAAINLAIIAIQS
jgi:undecaprenyl-diphosphatase